MAAPNPDRPLLVELPIRVRTYDIDFVGHVNNIVYVRWLEDLRMALLDTYLPLEPLRKRGLIPIIVNTSIHYRQPILLSDETVGGSLWAGSFERAIFQLNAEFAADGEIRCTATQRGTFVNTDTMRPARIPEELKAQFEAHQGGPARP